MAGTTTMKIMKEKSHWSESGSKLLDFFKGGEKQVVFCCRRCQEEVHP